MITAATATHEEAAVHEATVAALVTIDIVAAVAAAVATAVAAAVAGAAAPAEAAAAAAAASQASRSSSLKLPALGVAHGRRGGSDDGSSGRIVLSWVSGNLCMAETKVSLVAQHGRWWQWYCSCCWRKLQCNCAPG